ncbi:hypothetical protein WSK_0395 [Novosphingobium sp. Rr 2-17]|nr:hypothetical protein WSK_0395 [Novosphingobium sp. Rr 2-17]
MAGLAEKPGLKDALKVDLRIDRKVGRARSVKDVDLKAPSGENPSALAQNINASRARGRLGNSISAAAMPNAVMGRISSMPGPDTLTEAPGR